MDTKGNPNSLFTGVERRLKPRISDPIQVNVLGRDEDGERYNFNAVLKNISAGGLCAPTPRPLQIGEKLLLHIRFALAGTSPARFPCVLMHGKVLRTCKREEGAHEFAAAFARGNRLQRGISASPLRYA